MSFEALYAQEDNMIDAALSDVNDFESSLFEEDCYECNGTGTIKVNCNICHGTGWVGGRVGGEICCGGTEEAICSRCDGTRKESYE